MRIRQQPHLAGALALQLDGLVAKLRAHQFLDFLQCAFRRDRNQLGLHGPGQFEETLHDLVETLDFAADHRGVFQCVALRGQQLLQRINAGAHRG